MSLWIKSHQEEVLLGAFLIFAVILNQTLDTAYIAELILILPALLFIGIPHGSMDFFYIKKRAGSGISLLVWLAGYIALAIGTFFFCQYLPNVFWPVFFLISLFHFLVVEWESRNTSALFCPDIAFGALFILPVIQQIEARRIFSYLEGSTFFEEILVAFAPFFFVLFGILVVSRLIFFKNKIRHLFVLTVLSLATFVLPLWFTFFGFFVFIHSLRHLKRHLKEVKVQLEPKSYAILALISIFIIGLSFVFYQKTFDVLPRLTLILLCLTTPHMTLELLPRRGATTTTATE